MNHGGREIYAMFIRMDNWKIENQFDNSLEWNLCVGNKIKILEHSWVGGGSLDQGFVRLYIVLESRDKTIKWRNGQEVNRNGKCLGDVRD